MSTQVDDLTHYMQAVSRLKEELRRLRAAVEFDAAKAAYDAGLGASEWEAFVGAHTWAELAAAVPVERGEE